MLEHIMGKYYVGTTDIFNYNRKSFMKYSDDFIGEENLYKSTVVKDLLSEDSVETLDWLEGVLLDNMLLYDSKNNLYYLCTEFSATCDRSCYQILMFREGDEEEVFRLWEKVLQEGGEEYYSCYEKFKNDLREEAINWQFKVAEENLSYEDLGWRSEIFKQYARCYGLIGEFREEGII